MCCVDYFLISILALETKLSDNTTTITPPSSDTANQRVSISTVIGLSYQYFMSNFPRYMKLVYVPIILWVLVEVVQDFFIVEYNLYYDIKVPRAMISASFAIVWYRQFLLGSKHATYGQLFDNVLSPHVFDIYNFLKSITRIIITSILLFVPTFMLSLFALGYKVSQGMIVNPEVIQQVAIKSTTLMLLLCSPIIIRLSLYGAGVALGRRRMGIREVWKKTSGKTGTLWFLNLRAFLPISLYSYFLTWAFEIMADAFSLNYIWENLIVNIPAAFFTFMMLAIVVGANGEAFKLIFGIREKERDL